jgi:hypothetical protein
MLMGERRCDEKYRQNYCVSFLMLSRIKMGIIGRGKFWAMIDDNRLHELPVCAKIT